MRAVERLEIWAAFALLLVALVVGAAGTLAATAEMQQTAAGATGHRSAHVASHPAVELADLGAIASRLTSRAVAAVARTGELIALPGAAALGAVGGAIGLAALGLGLAKASRAALAGAARYMARTPRAGAGLQLPDLRAAARTRRRAAPEPRARPETLEKPPARRPKRARQDVAAPQAAGPATQPSQRRQLKDAAQPRLSVDDRALAAAQAAQKAMAHSGVLSPLLSVDVLDEQALVTLALRPEDETLLDRRFAGGTHAAHPGLRWSAPAFQVRPGDAPGRPLDTSAMLVPLLAIRRCVRYAPLASWRHLGVYGGAAHAAAHHVVATLLCQRRPDELGLAAIDRSGWASLYRKTPHWLDTPGDGPATAEMLTRALRRGTAVTTRPLLLVLVEPDGATLSAFAALLSRLRMQPGAPLHLMLVQQRLHPHARPLYLVLPALITAGGEGAPDLLRSVRRWPAHGTAVVQMREQAWHGRPFSSDETYIGELTRRLAEHPRSTTPVLWQIPAPIVDSPSGVQSAGS